MCFDMRYKKALKIWITSLIAAVFLAGCFLYPLSVVKAIGISPPGVINHNLSKGSHFQQVIRINQGAPKEELSATVEMNVSDKWKDWITIEPGMEFTVPIVRFFPVTITIDVPLDARLGNYNGEILITTFPEKKEGAQVSVGMGLAIELDLSVVEEEIIDFSVSSGKVQPMEQGWPVKISFDIKNKGNTKAGPEKVLLEVYSRIDGKFWGSGEATEFARLVEPFQRGEVIAEFPIDLEPGLYWAQIKFYKSKDEILEHKVPFEVLEKGLVPVEIDKSRVSRLIIGVGTGLLLLVIVVFLCKFGKKIFGAFGSRPRGSRGSGRMKKKFKKIVKILKEK